MSNVLNPEGIDITLNRMIISQIQMLVERYLIHRLLDISLSANSFVDSAEQTEKVPTGVISRGACGSFQCFFDEITANIS